MSLFQDQGLVKAGSMPAALADGLMAQPRVDEYGALHMRRELLAWAQEGSYFKATNPTLGTGIAMGVQTSFSDTANVLALMRNGSATKKVIPHYIRLLCTAAGSSSSQAQLAVKVDTANRYTSGGSDLTGQAKAVNTALSPASIVDVLRFGAITAAAASAARVLANALIKTQAAPCWAVGDEVLLNFVGPDGAHAGAPLAGSAAQQIVKNLGPLVLGAQNHCLLLHLWNVANATTPPSFEVELAWWER